MRTREETWLLLKVYGAAKGEMPLDLDEWVFDGVYLRRAYLIEINLRGVTLRDANLSGANLSGANLSDADLSGANLSGANLSDADLSGANLSRANLTNTELLRTTFLGSVMCECNLRNSTIINVNFNLTNLCSADITGATFWGISNTGWKIDNIKAEYVYFTQDKREKEKCKITFKEGQFEALFKSLPSIELTFEGGLSLPELWTLNAIIEDIKKQNPEFNLKLTKTTVNDFQTIIGMTTVSDEYLAKAADLIKSRIEEVMKGIPIEILLPYFIRMLPFAGLESYAHQAILQNQTVILNNPNFTISLIQGDGAISSHQVQHHERIESYNIFNNYIENKDEIDHKFNELKQSMSELNESTKKAIQVSADRLIEVLRKGKDVSQAQKIWNEIKEGLKTAGSAASIISALTRLLGM